MLIQKAISTKKLVIYISIIFFMICGTGLMLHQNKKLVIRSSTNINIPIIFNDSVPVSGATTTEDNIFMVGEINNQAAAQPNLVLDISKVNQSEDFNLNILSSEKFKMLRKSELLIKEKPEVGKRDPFKPN